MHAAHADGDDRGQGREPEQQRDHDSPPLRVVLAEPAHGLIELGVAAQHDQDVAAVNLPVRRRIGDRLAVADHGDDGDAGGAPQLQSANGLADSR